MIALRCDAVRFLAGRNIARGRIVRLFKIVVGGLAARLIIRIVSPQSSLICGRINRIAT